MYWKDYLYFTRPQRNGIKALLLLILIIVIAPALFRRMNPISPHDPGAFKDDIKAFMEMLETQEADGGIAKSGGGTGTRSAGGGVAGDDAGSGLGSGSGGSLTEIILSPVAFDPNQLAASDWEAMGIPAYVARSILNYREAGGSFRYREDLQRIYLMEEEWFRQLEPYIQLPARSKEVRAEDHTAVAKDETAGAERTGARSAGRAEHTGTRPPAGAERTGARSAGGAESTEVRPPAGAEHAEARPHIDLNRADTTALMEIRGIGPTFSRRILSYRELLGGYCHPDQLLEVYGMDSTRWKQLKTRVMIDTTLIRRMNLNEVSFEDLLRHPYIDRNLASSLIGIRDQHGPLQSREQVLRSYLVNDEVYRRIAPYLKAD